MEKCKKLTQCNLNYWSQFPTPPCIQNRLFSYDFVVLPFGGEIYFPAPLMMDLTIKLAWPQICEERQHITTAAAAAAAKSLQSCLTLCHSIEGNPPGSHVPGILQARILEWVAISFSNAWKGKVKVKLLSRAWLLATPWTAAFSVHGIVQARVLEWVAIAFSESLALRDITCFLLLLLSFFQPHEKILCARSVHASHWYIPILNSLNGPEKITNMQADKGPNCTLEPISANLSLYQPVPWLIY